MIALIAASFVTMTCEAKAPTTPLKSKREYKVVDKRGKSIKAKDKQITKAEKRKLAKQQQLAKLKTEQTTAQATPETVTAQ